MRDSVGNADFTHRSVIIKRRVTNFGNTGLNDYFCYATRGPGLAITGRIIIHHLPLTGNDQQTVTVQRPGELLTAGAALDDLSFRVCFRRRCHFLGDDGISRFCLNG